MDILEYKYPKGSNHVGLGNIRKINSAFEVGTLEEATKAFQDYFLRPGKPHEDRRLASAKELCSIFDTPEWEQECEENNS